MKGRAGPDKDGVLVSISTDRDTARWRCDYTARLSPENARELAMEMIAAADRAEDHDPR